ncbi:hypothetical protein [Burkholderia ubonensis]|uniref:hypothetical protein n=1 Tax=Burkholderia ubonensis TaxID=101571 RepID=UPI002ABE992F|nr:hypothetical protein [Burkholderia ubonensis]
MSIEPIGIIVLRRGGNPTDLSQGFGRATLPQSQNQGAEAKRQQTAIHIEMMLSSFRAFWGALSSLASADAVTLAAALLSVQKKGPELLFSFSASIPGFAR